jgi:hypothetical protein
MQTSKRAAQIGLVSTVVLCVGLMGVLLAKDIRAERIETQTTQQVLTTEATPTLAVMKQ